MGVEELLNFMKLELNELDEQDISLIEGLQLSAEEYLLGAGVIKKYDSNLYKLVVKIIVTFWHENREAASKRDLSALSLQSMIVQLRY